MRPGAEVARARLFSGPDDRRIKRALCIVAHPDDVEFYCGGTVLKMSGRGVMVDFVLATSGDKGTRDGSRSRTQVAKVREREQESAGRVLGANRVAFLRHPDAELVETLALREEFVREIRTSKPDVLLTFDPNVKFRYHPDHRVVGRVALDAAWPSARDPLTYPESGAPHETAEAWCFGGPESTLEVDVAGVIDAKIDARLAHASQTGSAAVLRRRWRVIGRVEKFHQVDLR
jgi:LmbE family N-acetylglucosaminyl deacetylase